MRRVGSEPPVGTLPAGATGSATRDVFGVTPDEVYEVLGSGPRGLTHDEARRRLAATGPNLIEETAHAPLLPRLLAQFSHLMAVLLWVGGLIAFTAGLPQLGIAVWLVNLINGAFSFWQEHRAEQAVAALRSLLPRQARVLREGSETLIDAAELVPGDVLLIDAGDRISADARVIDEHELRVDQSALTGETHPARRSSLPQSGTRPLAERANMVFAGTAATSGRGKAVVVTTGMHTEFGGIAGMTQSMSRELSPLQRELATLSRVVGVIAVAVGMVFFVLAQVLTDMPVGRGLVFALGMIVAFVPEGLLPTVTLALAMGTQRMARRHALVKRLSAVEALGSTTVICTDKTGTLTTNQMTVRRVFQLAGEYELTGAGYEPTGDVVRDGHPVDSIPDDLAELLRVGALANDARLLPPGPDRARWTVLGDPTEGALLVAAAKAGQDLGALADHFPRLDEWAFDSVRKRMSTLHRAGDGLFLAIKGAPQPLVDRCSHVRVDGVDVPLDAAARDRVTAATDAYSADALRVLAVATRRVDDAARRTAEEAEQGLTLLGLVAMLDPPRPEIEAAVATCQRAGIRILMLTGDYGVTAESIARRIGIVPSGGEIRIVNGDELDDLDDGALAALLEEPVLFARSTPAHKLRIVTALQARDEVVAVTGDGVNDAPALKKADIGIAMGASGTDVAREAADMVLLDDDFSSIVAAVEEGRAVYANIRKFTGYIFTSNTPEAVPFILFGLSGGRIPIALDVMHILAVDLGTDLAPALALGAERPEPGVMDRPPRRRDEHLITPALLRRSYLWLGPAQAAAVMLAFYLAYRAAGFSGWLDLPDSGRVYAAGTAAALAAVVTTQIGNLMAHRTERLSLWRIGLTTNRLVGVGIASELALILAIVYLPPLQSVIGTAPFAAWLWLPLVAMSPLLLLIDETRKALRRAREQRKARS